MPDPEITLVRSDASRKLEFLEMAEEFLAGGDARHKSAIDDLDAYFERAEAFRRGADLPEGMVPSTLFWLQRDGRILGQASLRPQLNENLRLEGGNIGYNIRPSERLRGYGTLILKLMLDEARKIGLEKVLITCDADNVGSRLIIEKNGGVLEGQESRKSRGSRSIDIGSGLPRITEIERAPNF
jgi:predicted acetyltransferase